MSVETLLRLALVPTAVWLASLAARRWGHSVSGYLGGFPLIGGPITLYLALDHGAAFAARSASVTLAVIFAQAMYLIAFAQAARRARWPVALASGWATFAIVSVLMTQLPLDPPLALASAVAGLAIAWRMLPHPREEATLPAVPPIELRLRLAAALVLAAVILWGAREFGPVVSGLLLSVPVTGSIMPPFTLALYGPDAVARLARGFVVGLSGFMAFFFVVASCATALGVAGTFALAAAAALVTSTIASRVLKVAAIEEAGLE